VIVTAAAAGLSVAAVVLTDADSTSEPGVTVAVRASVVAGLGAGFDAPFAVGFNATLAAGFDAADATGFDAAGAAGLDATFAAGFDATAGFDAATDTVEIDARCGPALPAASPSSVGCRAVISAAAARTHVMPTTIMRQLYAFGGGGIDRSGGFAAAAVLAAGALERALVPLKRSDSFRSEIF
jgi:hypothetical protein